MEVTDKWLHYGNVWEIARPGLAQVVKLGGHTEWFVDDSGKHRVRSVPGTVVIGIPYDTPALGYRVDSCALLRFASVSAYARNIEIKAHIESIEALAPKAAALAAEGPIQLTQDDTFFRCDSGRLKLRVLSATEAQLIFYRRANQRGPKESFYVRNHANDEPAKSPRGLKSRLRPSRPFVKKRTLYVVGRTRVHLDQVEGLYYFL